MYYTPAVVIPGKVAHLDFAIADYSAKHNGTYVLNDDFEIVADYRDKEDEDEQDWLAE